MTTHRYSPTETLDERIDRVAQAMTAAPIDAGFAARVRERLDSGHNWFAASRVAVVAVAAVVVLLAVRVAVPTRAPITTTPTARSAGTLAATAHAPEIVATPDRVSPTVIDTPARTARRVVITHDPVVPPIEPLKMPESIAVAQLQDRPLTIAPIEIAPLAMDDLAISALDLSDAPKE